MPQLVVNMTIECYKLIYLQEEKYVKLKRHSP